ncbi:MAG: carbohydrate binding family 9 domain-containing protein, partial [Bacteroidetes bacterium]|nr:carbohydrate binding family 9 domain-containing protein [Bacteroidota bacterium]
MKTTSTLVILFFAFFHPVFCQQPPDYTVHIRKTTQPVHLDGLLDEPAWQDAETLGHFKMNFPVDTSYTKFPTEVRLCFDDKYLYVAARCTQDRNTYTIPSLKRDFPNGTSDVINIIIGPFKDGVNGFLFGVNPLNVQREALIDNGANLSYEWDNKWASAVHNEPEQWTVEIAIPFKTLRYKVSEGENSWQINFVRTKLKGWEVSTWRPVPQQYSPNNLAFTGNLIWDTPPPHPGANVAVIPYASGRYDIDYPRDAQGYRQGLNTNGTPGIGGDAKIAITPSLNLDLTVNPDFSQVEVDRQVPNLSRFELFFPERRQFFLENRDLFALFGFPTTRPFFSRRIGLARNPLTGINTTVPILGG